MLYEFLFMRGCFMKSNTKDKFHNAILEALTEPAFIFSPEGQFQSCNGPASDVLKTLGYTNGREPEYHDTFIQTLFASAQDKDDTGFVVGGVRYGVVTREFEAGSLLRLMPGDEGASVSHLLASLEVIPWGLVVVNFSGEGQRVVFGNRKAGDFLQRPHADLKGQSVFDVFSTIGVPEGLADLVASDEIKRCDHEARVDGRVTWYRFHFIPYAADHSYCLIVVEDTTDSKIMEGQYFQSQRLEALGQLAGGVAHDFNNILSIIDGYARVAKKSVKDNPDAVGYMERIAQSVQRGSALTNQLLTFGRHKVVKDSITNLGHLVRDQEPLLRPLMDASIALSIVAGENIFVEVSPDHICQILLNLCVNSRDAMPDGGSLVVEVTTGENNTAVLRITDTGCGMAPDVKSRMFDPFFTTKDQGAGTGLGLSMVYGLVKDMKGEIAVASKEGSGTSITVTLPLSEKKPEIQEILKQEDGSVLMNGYTAMIAEDEPDLLNLLSGLLEEMGLKVLRASNGSEALLLQDDYDGEIDFLLTDVVMPELNGVKLAELFESLRPKTKVMFMSGYPANGQMARVPLPEGAYLMPKPLDFQKLGTVLAGMVNEQNNDLKDKWHALTGQWRSA